MEGKQNENEDVQIIDAAKVQNINVVVNFVQVHN